MPQWFDLFLSKLTPLVWQFLLETTDDTALGVNDDISSFDLIIVPLLLTTRRGWDYWELPTANIRWPATVSTSSQ